jgi:hypothetical protein
MPGTLRWVVPVLFLGVTVTSCQRPPAEEEDGAARTPSESTVPANLPLKEIMRGLETDLADLAHGIWTEDPAVSGAAARRIALHPKVIPEQMAAIQASLMDEFPAFVQQDLGVHDAAVGFAEAARPPVGTAELFAIYLRIQQGCMSCHSAFRARVTEALKGPGGAGG